MPEAKHGMEVDPLAELGSLGWHMMKLRKDRHEQHVNPRIRACSKCDFDFAEWRRMREDHRRLGEQIREMVDLIRKERQK